MVLGVFAATIPAPAVIPACPTIRLTFARSPSSQSSRICNATTAGSSEASVFRGVVAATAPAPYVTGTPVSLPGELRCTRLGVTRPVVRSPSVAVPGATSSTRKPEVKSQVSSGVKTVPSVSVRSAGKIVAPVMAASCSLVSGCACRVCRCAVEKRGLLSATNFYLMNRSAPARPIPALGPRCRTGLLLRSVSISPIFPLSP